LYNTINEHTFIVAVHCCTVVVQYSCINPHRRHLHPLLYHPPSNIPRRPRHRHLHHPLHHLPRPQPPSKSPSQPFKSYSMTRDRTLPPPERRLGSRSHRSPVPAAAALRCATCHLRCRRRLSNSACCCCTLRIVEKLQQMRTTVVEKDYTVQQYSVPQDVSLYFNPTRRYALCV